MSSHAIRSNPASVWLGASRGEVLVPNVSHGADVTDAFRRAVDHRDLETVNALLEQGAAVNAYLPGGETALMMAVQGVIRMRMVRLLLARGADPHLQVRGVSPLMYVEDRNPTLYRVLFAASADSANGR